MADPFTMIIVAILIVFSFDFFNGFHDAANAIATIVATKVLTPTKAVAMAAVGNFVGMVFITNAIAETIGKGIIDTNVLGVNTLPLSNAALFHSMAIIMGGVAGAIGWDLITWLWGLPTSSSHALIGGLVGATSLAAGPGSILLPSSTNMLLFVFVTGMAFVLGAASFFAYDVIIRRHRPTLGTLILAGLLTGLLPAVILGKILLKGLVQIAVYMVAAPLVGLVFAFGLALVVIRLFRRHTPTKVNHEFKRLQLVSSFFYSVTHGTNDAQKGMGIITLILVVAAIGPPWGPPSGAFLRRLAHRAHDVSAGDAPPTVAGLLRRDRGRHRASEQCPGGNPREHDSRDRFCDHGRRRDEAAVGGPLGGRPTDFLGLDHHDSRVRGNGNGCIRGAPAHVRSLRPAPHAVVGWASRYERSRRNHVSMVRKIGRRWAQGFEAARHVEAIPRFRSWAPARI